MFFDPHTETQSLLHAPDSSENAGMFEEAAEGAAAGQELHTPAPSKEPQGRFLKNPLPLPERRPHVRMEFDLTDDWDIPEEEEHFDFEIAEDDDFDI